MPSNSEPERATWTRLSHREQMCFGRGCFTQAAWLRQDSHHRGVGYYCDACAVKARAKEAAHG